MAADLAKVQQALNELSSLSVGQAKKLLTSADEAIKRAADVAAAAPFQSALTGGQTRYNVLLAVESHLAALDGYADSVQLPAATIASVKQDATSAAIELNAAEEGRALADDARGRIFGDMVIAAKGLAAAVVDGAVSIANVAVYLVAGLAVVAVAGVGLYLYTTVGKVKK